MINLLCALTCESKPIIKYFKLKHYSNASLYNTFINENHSISLTVTGIGKYSSAGAVIHTYMLLSSDKYDGWINFGIAGHSTLKLGTPIIANKIVDNASLNAWYPQILFDNNIRADTIITLDKPSSIYPEHGAIDMEASGFYEMASKIGSIELCHSIKIISDNDTLSYKKINSQLTEELIYRNIRTINELTVKIASLQSILKPPNQTQKDYEEIIRKWHFTTTQRLQLKKLLNRWNTLLPNKKINWKKSSIFSNSKQIISYLNKKLDNTKFKF